MSEHARPDQFTPAARWIDRTLRDEVCGLAGNSDEGYCTCDRPAGHETSHGCQHGSWR